MPRMPRFYQPDVPVHIVHRGHSKESLFFEAQDYATYAYWLKEAGEKYRVSIHAFVLMTNHIHSLVTPLEGRDISLFMHISVGVMFLTLITNRVEVDQYGRGVISN
jgi:putative transposase